eukprot:2912103-Amphidinium_carterae.2
MKDFAKVPAKSSPVWLPGTLANKAAWRLVRKTDQDSDPGENHEPRRARRTAIIARCCAVCTTPTAQTGVKTVMPLWLSQFLRQPRASIIRLFGILEAKATLE